MEARILDRVLVATPFLLIVLVGILCRCCFEAYADRKQRELRHAARMPVTVSALEPSRNKDTTLMV